MADKKPCPTNHATLYFGSGDFYIFCNDCYRSWRIEQPSDNNVGPNSEISGEHRVKANGDTP